MFHFHTKQKVKSHVCTHKFCSQTYYVGDEKNERRSFTKKSSEYFTAAFLQDHNVTIQLIVGLRQKCVAIPFLQLLQMEH